jgi:hypothetical protein
MEETLVLLEENQIWIYMILVIAGLLYLRLSVSRWNALQSTFFGLERERARGKLIRSVTMLGLVFVGVITLFVLTTFAGPSLPISSRPTVMPTVSLLRTPDVEGENPEGLALATPINDENQSAVGCTNPDATLRSPQDGDALSGRIDVLGVANISGFAFYKLEIRSVAGGNEWRAIAAGTKAVCGPDCDDEFLLGSWDTSLITPGEYEFRLVVMDTVGNAPLPCTINVRVLPVE